MNKKTFVLFIFLAAALIALDQVTKNMVVTRMEFAQKIELIKGFLSLYYVRNTGSAFSLLADKTWGIYVLTGLSAVMAVFLVILLYMCTKKDAKLPATALCLLFSGAVGNLIDRAVLKSVVDFIRFDFGTYTFPIFNVADICAVVGTALIIICIIFKPEKFDLMLEGLGIGVKDKVQQ